MARHGDRPAALLGERALRGRAAASRYLLNAAALLAMPICVALTFVVIDADRPANSPAGVGIRANPMIMARLA